MATHSKTEAVTASVGALSLVPPSPPRPDLDALLAEYLEEQRRNPVRETMERIANEYANHEKKDQTRHEEVMSLVSKMREDQTSHHYRISNLEKQAAVIEKEVEDTGRYRIDSLVDFKKKAEIEKAETAKRESERRWQIVLLVLSIVLTGAITFFAGHSVGAGHAPEMHPIAH